MDKKKWIYGIFSLAVPVSLMLSVGFDYPAGEPEHLHGKSGEPGRLNYPAEKPLTSSQLYQKDSTLYLFETTRKSVEHLTNTYGEFAPRGKNYLRQIHKLKAEYLAAKKGKGTQEEAYLAKEDRNHAAIIHQIHRDLVSLQKTAILSSPVIDFDEMLLVKRKINLHNWEKTGQQAKIWRFGFPTNHECNSSPWIKDYEDELAILSGLPDGKMHIKTLYKSDFNGYTGEVDLHWDAGRILFSELDRESWKVKEIDLSTGEVRQISRTATDVDCFDAAYLPNGKIVFGSTANFQSVPCWHGQRRVSNLYLMNGDGSGMRRLCFDQDHDLHPTVLSNGQILFNRWDYTGIAHIYLRIQMVMNPDGTAQRAIYGSNSWFPNSLYFSREIPGRPGRLVSILSGYHGVPRMGQLVVIDTKRDWHEDKGLVARISGKGEPITPEYYDNLVHNDWPKFVTPYPLADRYFLVSVWKKDSDRVGIYLADEFDNLILIKEVPGYALLEPVPLKKNPTPPVIPDKVQPDEEKATVYIHNIYNGPGLEGVPEGTVDHIRVIAYNFGLYQMAGPNKAGYGGPWEVTQIVGTTPVEKDGSAMFKIPANTPVAFQTVDHDGGAVQLMRSWVTAMPGEIMSCVGCHESPNEIAPPTRAIAARKKPVKLEEWYGRQRGFDFEREVQPVLNNYCIACHNGNNNAIPDLRSEEHFPDYRGKMLSRLGKARLHPVMKEAIGVYHKYTPAYDALIPYIRRVSVEDKVNMLTPAEYHPRTSPLIQILRKGHHGVELNREAWDRLYTWIDLNGPCHGTWNDAFPVPEGMDEKRRQMDLTYGGPALDPEYVPETRPFEDPTYERRKTKKPPSPEPEGWPLSHSKAKALQTRLGEHEKSISLGDGVQLELIKIPAGKFVMGDVKGQPDEWPQQVITIAKPFWMARFEISNRQFRAFNPEHSSSFYGKRHNRTDDRGLTLDHDEQPAVRVSWDEAMAFCRWLSQETGMQFSLPTEAQWEYACRAGSATPMYFGDTNDDFSDWANLGDQSFGPTNFQSGGVVHMVMDGADLAHTGFDDDHVVTASAGSFQPNAWGLFDMHGNASEWVASDYHRYPYRETNEKANLKTNKKPYGETNERASRKTAAANTGANSQAMKVVRGGSFYDHPKRARSAYRVSYPSWQKLFNVGFRVIAETE